MGESSALRHAGYQMWQTEISLLSTRLVSCTAIRKSMYEETCKIAGLDVLFLRGSERAARGVDRRGHLTFLCLPLAWRAEPGAPGFGDRLLRVFSSKRRLRASDERRAVRNVGFRCGWPHLPWSPSAEFVEIGIVLKYESHQKG